MACCGPANSDPESRKKSKDIDETIKNDRKDDVKRVKLLLLGSTSMVTGMLRKKNRARQASEAWSLTGFFCLSFLIDLCSR
jgi:hypothetical protein